MRQIGAVLLAGALALIVGSAPRAAGSTSLSFAPSTGVITSPSNASVIVDRSTGTFVRRRPGTDIAIVDAMGDLNRDGRADLVTHFNEDQEDACGESDGVEVCTAYAYVSLGKRDGTFGRPRRVYTSDSADVAAAAVGDVNGDGRPDVELATADDSLADTVRILLGLGNGRFRSLFPGNHGLRTGHSPVAIEAIDVNGDGRRDIVTATGSGTASLFLSRGGGSFATRRYRVGPHPSALAVGDLNGDRRPDLAVARASGATHVVTVLLNRGGSFPTRHSYPTGTQPRSVAIGDLNGDGRPDLVSGNSDAGTTSVLLNEGRGRFAEKLDYATGRYTFAVAIGRLAGDQRRDVVVETLDGATVLVNTPGLCNVQDVYGLQLAAATHRLARSSCRVGTVTHVRSRGFAAGRVIGETPDPGAVVQGGTVDLVVSDGPGPGRIAAAPSFGAAKSYALPGGGQSVAVADVNGDGAPDVVTANCGHSVSVLLNRGHGALAARQDYRTADCPQTVALADLNGDGRPDIVAGGEDGIVSVLLNQGDGTFGPKHDYERGGVGDLADVNFVAVGDLNGDGKPDLATANGFESRQGISVFLNNGYGTFGARQDYSLAGGPESIGIGDLNGDGKLDLVTDKFGDLTVLLNQGGGAFDQTQVVNTSGSDYSYVFVGDLTGDGYADAAIMNLGSGSVDVLVAKVTGTLRPYTAYRASRSLSWVAIADANRDGTQDLVTSGKSVSILRNRGDATFLAPRGYTMGTRLPRSVALGDLNGDGKPDVVSANGRVAVVRLAR